MSGWGRGRASDWTLPLGRKTARTTTAEGPTCHCPPKESGVEPPDAYGSSRRKFPAQRERPRSKQEVSVVSPLLRVLMCVGGTGGQRHCSLLLVLTCGFGRRDTGKQTKRKESCVPYCCGVAGVCVWVAKEGRASPSPSGKGRRAVVPGQPPPAVSEARRGEPQAEGLLPACPTRRRREKPQVTPTLVSSPIGEVGGGSTD